MFKNLVLTAFLLPLSITALAQPATQAPPVGYSGALIEYSDSSVTLKEKNGNVITVAMTPGWTVETPRTLNIDAIKPGSFVATANTNIDANTGKAYELRIFTPGYKPEEGTHLMAQQPNTSMTHGTVTSASKSAAGVELEIVYPDGARHIIVPSDVKITGYEVHERSTLTPGVTVAAVVRKGSDGVLRAGRLVLSTP